MKYTQSQLVNHVENLGGQVQAVASREMLMYQASIFPQDLSKTMDILGQIVRYPRFDPEELEEAKTAAGYEINDNQWDPLMTLPEKLHAIAYQSVISWFHLECT
jgi:processing peptidase subunit alpha